MRIGRKKKGSVIAFSTVLALALVLLGIGFVFLLMYMGGQNETKNAVDAGTLNVGKQVLDQISVTLSPDPSEQCFYDVTNDADDGSSPNDGKVTLRRINRVWAQALLIGINADAAQSDGTVGNGNINAGMAIGSAQRISQELSQQLTTVSNWYTFFSNFSQANSVRMIGSTVQTNVLPGANWQTSLMDRTPITTAARESNIVVNGSASNNYNMPASYNLNSSFVTAQTRNPPVQSGIGLTFLKGYTPLTAAGQTLWQVPFQYDEKPRLVSQSVFNQSTNTANPLSWDSAIPNAYSAEGSAVKAGASGEKAVSWVLTNPRQTFQMSIPHSFLHIHLDGPVTKWFFFPTGYPPIEIGSEQSYGYDSITTQSSIPVPEGGVLCATVTADSVDDIGMDVVGRTLDQIIFGPPDGSTTTLETQMTNRVNEMISKTGKVYTASDMHSALGSAATIGELAAGQTDFYVYSPDGVNLSVVSQMQAQVTPTWLAQMYSNTPDGTETQLVNDASVAAPIFFMPDVTPDPDCFLVFALGYATWDKSLYWQPGTGYNGCLGQVRVTRWTDVYSLGVCGTTVI
jgi:hypothetical protein